MFVGVLTRNGVPHIAVRVGTTGIPALISPDAAQTLREHIQAACDQAELSRQLADRRDRKRSDAIRRIGACADASDTAGRDAAIIDAIDAGATFGDAANASGLAIEHVRETWRDHLGMEQGSGRSD
ncbi:MAG: hypothetical protein GEU93_22190 [Propionibacteriales bacterium]|nr:hypothetical protein [Propionibacteriales bacterium]